MSVVWILEKAKPATASAAVALMGDYAVRLFASLASFETVLKFDRRTHPDLLVIDFDDAGATAARLAEFVAGHFVDTPVVVLVPPETSWPDGDAAVCVTLKPIDSLELSVLAGFLMRDKKRRHVIRYRDLVLDVERLQCVVLPGEDTVSLPLKEAQILKLLLGKPGACLSRQEISAALWSGIKVTPRTIDSHVSRLRKRLKDAAVTIESVYGGGYVLR